MAPAALQDPQDQAAFVCEVCKAGGAAPAHTHAPAAEMPALFNPPPPPSPKANGAVPNGHVPNGHAQSGVAGGGHAAEEEEEEVQQEWAFPVDRLKGYGVDERDANTPDRWVRRHPDLVRLTGKHPFNCEAPLKRLMEHGFLTPVALHYVRNHGPVPQAGWDEWRVEVRGLVRRPGSLSMADLLAMPARTLPVTLVCAGNRRKEQNMVRQSIGFNWGAAGVSTSVWRGVRLRDVLKRCGILPRGAGALYVGFEGAETLPGGGGSKYGTSLRREVAMSAAADVILAYEQNGARLEPDHGYPVRVIIPGFIGGRMVKWLRTIEVTEKESSNHYHYNDNRVLPSHVDAELASKEGWWYKPDYIINELNINSVISTPAHGEIFSLNDHMAQKPYEMKGYAYSGGGRKVIRVEVSLDSGATWKLADVTYTEKPTVHGKYWCWCHWSLRVDVLQLLQAKELVARAWDEGMNTQPQQLTWNVMGMMNNCWFRVKMHPTRPADGGLGLRFEHPTRPGNEAGGWMVKAEEPPPAAAAASATAAAAVPGGGGLRRGASTPHLSPDLRSIPLSEVKRHDSADSAWIVVHGRVYDCTRFLDDHPGGADSILINAGTDSTDEFDAIHSAKAKAMLEDYLIGNLAAPPDPPTPEGSLRGGNRLSAIGEAAAVLDAAAVPEAGGGGRLVALDPKRRIPFRLVEKRMLSHDTRLFRFALQSPEHVLGLPVGKHMFLSATVDGKFVMRAYTPTSSDDDVGYFDLVIKVYFRGHEKFPLGGVMSQHLESLQVGDTIDVKGPTGHIHYIGRGRFTANGKPRAARRIAMLAGGTGITPMYQVVKAILKDPGDETEVWLVSANRTEADILLKDDLEAWGRRHPNFRVHFTLSQAPAEWTAGRGYICEAMLREHIPPGGPGTVAFLCGPPGMLDQACKPSLAKVGYATEDIYVF